MVNMLTDWLLRSTLLLTALIFALKCFHPRAVRNVFYGFHTLIIGVIPIGLSFWYSHTWIYINTYWRVYPSSSNIIFYFSDLLGLTAVLFWLIGRVFEKLDNVPAVKQRPRFQINSLLHIEFWFLALCVLSTLSAAWSLDWRISLFASLQLWIVFGVFLSLRGRPEVWKAAAFGFCAALILQSFFGIWESVTISVDFLSPLKLIWLEDLSPSFLNDSIIQANAGTRVMRAFGSLPHPNILGGFIVLALSGLIALLMKDARKFIWTTVITTASAVLLILTFSRSAWLGLVVATLFLIGYFFRKTWKAKWRVILLAALIVGGVFALTPLRELIFARLQDVSNLSQDPAVADRFWLVQQSIDFIHQRPWLGFGMEAYSLESAVVSPGTAYVDPVHNIPLLITSELGLIGAIILAGLFISFILGNRNFYQPTQVIFFAAIIGMFVIAMFDHYFWSLSPGRMMFGFMLGLWAGQTQTRAEYESRG